MSLFQASHFSDIIPSAVLETACQDPQCSHSASQHELVTLQVRERTTATVVFGDCLASGCQCLRFLSAFEAGAGVDFAVPAEPGPLQ